MKLFQAQGCPFAHRVRITLEEKKLPYEVSYFSPRERPAQLTALSPDARSPTLFDDDGRTAVWNSLVVIEYLEDRYPNAPLMPGDAPGRARVRLLERDVEDHLMAAGYFIAQEVVHKPPAERDAAKVREGLARIHEALIPWDQRLDGKTFLVDEQFTFADVVLFTPLYSMTQLLGEQGDIPESLRHLREWRDRVAKRPSTAY
jgi:glutathione S-transferase